MLFRSAGQIILNGLLIGIFRGKALLILIQFLLQMIRKRKDEIAGSINHHDLCPCLKDIRPGLFLIVKDMYLRILRMRFDRYDTSISALIHGKDLDLIGCTAEHTLAFSVPRMLIIWRPVIIFFTADKAFKLFFCLCIDHCKHLNQFNDPMCL